MKPKLFVPDYWGYMEPWQGLFDRAQDIENADCLMFTGGEDIDPARYNKLPHMSCHFNPRRDHYELACYKIARERDIPIIGICRGAQLLCALAGGELAQHVDGHGRGHTITTKDGEEMYMSSLHHQMMVPTNTDHVMIAWSTEPRSWRYLTTDEYGLEATLDVDKEPEIVYFKGIKGLAIQGHPEMMNPNQRAVQYCNDLAKEYLL